MKNIITAINNPELNNEIKKEKNLKIINKDIIYKEGIIEILEEKKEIKKINDENKEMLNSMKEIIGSDISDVRFTHRLKNHPVCLVSEGPVSIEMQKVLNAMPTDQSINAKIILEINSSHKIADKLKELYKSDKEKFNEYTKILYSQSRLIEGLSIENPTEISNLICDLLSK